MIGEEEYLSSQDEEIRSTITSETFVIKFVGRDLQEETKQMVLILRNAIGEEDQDFFIGDKIQFCSNFVYHTREKFANQLLRDREGKRLARKIRATYGQIDGRPLQLRRNVPKTANITISRRVL